MADAGAAQLGLGFGVEVEDEASKPLGEIEKAYVSLMKNMDMTLRQTSKLMNKFSEQLDDVEDAVDDVSDSHERSVSKFAEMRDALRENIFSLEDLGISWGKMIKFLGAVSVGALVLGVVMFFKRAAQAAIEFRKEVNQLNEVYQMSTRDAVRVQSTVQGLTGTFGRTRDEVLQLTRSMLDIGLTPKAIKAAGGAFRDTTKDILAFSSATGVGLGEAAEFADQLIRINKIPIQNIRRTAAGFKAIADNARITSSELISLNKQLEPLFTRMAQGSEKSREEFTLNVAALAGELSELGIDGGKAMGDFDDMLNRFSESGVEALNRLSAFTGIGTEQLREMIRENPATVFDQVAKSAAKLSPDQLEFMAQAMKPLNLSFAELNRLAERGRKVQLEQADSFVVAAQKAAEKAAKERALQEAAQKRTEAFTNRLDKLAADWRETMEVSGVQILDNIVMPLSEKVIPLLRQLANWTGTKGPRDLIDFFSAVGGAIATVAKGLALISKYNPILFLLRKVLEYMQERGAKEKEAAGVAAGFETAKGQKILDNISKAATGAVRESSVEFGKASLFLQRAGQAELESYATALATQTELSMDEARERIRSIQAAGVTPDDLRRRKAAAARGESVVGAGVNFPDTMRTRSPEQEALAKEQLRATQAQTAALRSGIVGVNVKHGRALAAAGIM